MSEKIGKMWKKVKNDEKGSDIAEKSLNWLKMKNNIFWISSRKYGKMSKKAKNDEKGSYIAERGLN